MGLSLTRKLIESHLVAGKAVAGEEIGVKIDQILLTDTNGNMSLLQLEAMGLPRVAQERVVAYIDHNVYQFDSRNTDDHRYMQTAARKYGGIFSKPGNGICHQVHMETFAIPGCGIGSWGGRCLRMGDYVAERRATRGRPRRPRVLVLAILIGFTRT
jgi:aconitate hydratase